MSNSGPEQMMTPEDDGRQEAEQQEVGQEAAGQEEPVQQEVAQQEPIPPKPGPGVRLAAQREARALTIEQVAHQLNLAPRQIQALESDNYAALPGLASVRGFIRSYAKLLKIDAEPLLATIANDIATVVSEPAPMRRALPASYSDDTRLPSMGGYGAPSKSLIGVIVLALLLGGGYVVYRSGWVLTLPKSLPLKDEAPAIPVPMPAPVAEQGTEAPVSEQDKLADKPVAAGENAANVTVNTPAAAPNAGAGKNPAAVPQATPANTQPADAAAGKDKLVLKFRETSWVEIRRPNSNNILFSQLVEAGANQAFDMTGPVSMIIGNAAGVDVSLRGTPVDIRTGVINNVAHINLK